MLSTGMGTCCGEFLCISLSRGTICGEIGADLVGGGGMACT